MVERFFPFVTIATESVQFWIEVGDEVFLAAITRECLRDQFGCSDDFMNAAVPTYFANQTAIDRVARAKHAAGKRLVLTASDF